MSTTTKPIRILSSGYIKLKVKAISNKKERKLACTNYLSQMDAQRLEQKRTRSKVEDTDDSIRFLKTEIEYLG